MIVLDGKAVAAQMRAEIHAEVENIRARGERVPGLCVILVGEDPASQVYVRNKERACEEVGVVSQVIRMPETTTQESLLGTIDDLNADPAVDGILLQLPLPRGLDTQKCLTRIAPHKDVDGFHPENMGRLVQGLPGLRPCTPAGVMELLRRYDITCAGKHAVVVGRSTIVGKPMALMLLEAHATVSVCHSRTPDLGAITRQADILVAAVGMPCLIREDMVAEGAVVVDVGINRTEAGLVGDCDYPALTPKAAAMTPVPGGVGPMTIAMLLANTLTAYRQHSASRA
ncbi:MAG: methylenetetrahydrofolate dehydrogenase / methenyltetrahydrofolate cyclohydrolase [Desulfomicrobiaceae bacterium]|nr:methylenetetrahydrofolate dehydrogenase / methenyltetrahydrofolate cyclohydrolase [Desulfomicrobiaceae bacterium]